MPIQCIEQTLKTELVKIGQLNLKTQIVASPEDVVIAQLQNQRSVQLPDVSSLTVYADDLEPMLEQHGRT